MTVYVDILIILNIYVNYFLLRITSKLTRSPLKTLRCVFASTYGSLFSLLIFAPELPYAVSVAVKLAAAVTIVIAAFGIHGKSRFFKNSAAFFGTNFILAGGVYAAYSIFKPSFMHFSNSYFYIDFSMLLLIITTALLYLTVSILRRLSDNSAEGDFSVIIRIRGKICRIDGLADTGNAFTDVFSGKPVIICSDENIGELPAGVRFRVLPVTTVSGSGLMRIFTPDEVLIINETSGERKPADAVIGLGETGGKAVFNPNILKY